MADPLPDTAADRATPLWVKLSTGAGLLVLVLVAIMLLTGHGPGHHLAGMTMPPGMTMGGTTPAGGAAPDAPTQPPSAPPAAQSAPASP